MQPFTESAWTDEAANAVKAFTQQWQDRSSQDVSSNQHADTLLLPLLKWARWRSDRRLRRSTDPRHGFGAPSDRRQPPTLALTSGYFSLYKRYKDLLLQAKAARSALSRSSALLPRRTASSSPRVYPAGSPKLHVVRVSVLERAEASPTAPGTGRRKRKKGASRSASGRKRMDLSCQRHMVFTSNSRRSRGGVGPYDGAYRLEQLRVALGESGFGVHFLVSTRSKHLSHRFKDEF